jgi:hypothetical protein
MIPFNPEVMVSKLQLGDLVVAGGAVPARVRGRSRWRRG